VSRNPAASSARDRRGEPLRRAACEPLVGVEPQHPLLAALLERELALRAEPVQRAG